MPKRSLKTLGAQNFLLYHQGIMMIDADGPKRLISQLNGTFLFHIGRNLKIMKSRPCVSLGIRGLYIAADGSVHPCCFAHCMYITEHNKLFGYIVPVTDKYYKDINFKTTPLQEILAGSYFEEVYSKSKTNKYCTIKCNKYKKEIRKELVLYDTSFKA